MVSELKSKSNFSEAFIERLHRTQRILSRRLMIQSDKISLDEINYVAGVDVAYKGRFSIGAVSVLRFPELEEVEVEITVKEVRFPYISTLLGFREIPAVLPSIRKLKTMPEVFLVDGHGYAHPERFGFASHLGLILKTPTIGVAKAVLVGKLEPSGYERYMWIKDHGEVIGAALYISGSKKPIFVSVGDHITLSSAVKIVEECIRSGRIPEPIRCAHLAANREKNRLREM